MEKSTIKRYCHTLDLKDDIVLIEKYKFFHSKQGFWPEVGVFIKECGIENMEIYLYKTRLFMIVEVNEGFSQEKVQELKKKHPKDDEWEALMLTFQKLLPESTEDQRWIPMEKIFDFSEHKN